MNLRNESGRINDFIPFSGLDSADLPLPEAETGEPDCGSNFSRIQFVSGLMQPKSGALNCIDTESHLRLQILGCLYNISCEMQAACSTDDLFRKLIMHVSMVWQPSDEVFPYLEISDRFFIQDEAKGSLGNKLSVPVKVDGETVGQLGIFCQHIEYPNKAGFNVPDFLNSVAQDIGAWLQRKRLRDMEFACLNDVRMTERAINEHAIVAITDSCGKIQYVNQKFCAVSKYSADELIGQDHRIINSGYHARDFFRNLWSTISKGKIWKGEIKNRAKDGSFYWVDTTIIPFLDENGSSYRYVAIRTEVTAHKKLEAKMEDQVAELARSNDELEQFAYVVTHDLQEPLRAITSFVQLLKKYCNDRLDERANDLIAHAVAGANRMQMLIDDLLTYAQVNSSQAMVEVNCGQLLSNVLIDLSIVIDECEATVTHDKLPVVKGIPFQLIQLFTNLINNALKFKRVYPPKVHVGVKENLDEWVFAITDNGIGIEEQYLDRIFRVFQRLHSRKDYSGTGIGLAICKKVVEHHGGRIWVESEPNVGSSFYFSIPK
jgi:chemotaxis family two-component system sensor kinase Cph1